MQGNRNTIGSIPDSINFDLGSTSSNVGIDQQGCWGNLRDRASSADTFVTTLADEGQNINRWLAGEPSSSTPPNMVNHDEQMVQNGWPSSSVASASLAPRLEGHCFQPASGVPRNVINLNLDGNHQTVKRPSFMQFHRSGSTSQSYDLNVGPLDQACGDNMECINSSKTGGVENKLMLSANPSHPLYSAASGDYPMEDDDSRPGCSLDGRRLSCKRKSFEGNAGQSSSSGSCLPREISIWPDFSPLPYAGSSRNASTPFESSPGVCPPYSLNPMLGLGVGGLLPESRAPNVSVGVQSSQRNYRMRINPSNHHNSVPDCSYLNVANGHSNALSVHQPLRLLPTNPPLDLMSSIPPSHTAAHSQSLALPMPLQRDMQPLRWNTSTTSRPVSSSIASGSPETDAPLNNNLGSSTMTRNTSEYPMFPPVIEARALTRNPPHWGLSSASATFPRNVASSSHSGPSSGSHSSAEPNWDPHRLSQSQYSRRLSDYVRRSLLSSIGTEVVSRGHSILAHHSASAYSQEFPPFGSGYQGQNRSYRRSALRVERNGDGDVGAPYSLRQSAAAGEGRSRLVSEIRNVLDIMRRGEVLRFEDIMLLDPTVIFGVADLHDQHRDMRLDVDNMSYEELLALEERIGNVCTGLSEETVLSRMKRHMHFSSTGEGQMELEPCCICQENYNDGEDMGTLDCGHHFHTDCIKRWLAQKNLCPICKTTALAS